MGKCFYSGPDKDKAKYVLKLPRDKLAIIVRIISGHNSLSYFRHKVDPDVDPTCRLCEMNMETFHHLIDDCPRFLEYRRDKLRDQIITNDHMWSVQELLDFASLPDIRSALAGPDGEFVPPSLHNSSDEDPEENP